MTRTKHFSPAHPIIRSNQAGVAAITSLLVISVVVASIVLSIGLLGIGESQNSLTYKKGLEALTTAESCTQEALWQLRNDGDYTGQTLQLHGNSCTIEVVANGANKVVTVTSQISGPPTYSRQLEITARRAGNSLVVLDWQEI